MYRVYWDKAAEPINNTVPRILYDLRRDEEEDLLMDAIREDDIYHEYGSKLEFDALITPYNRVERKMMIMRRFLNRAGNELKVREDAPDAPGLEITKPFKRNGSVQVAAIFYLTDGQTITIMFHNPDTTPNKLAPNDVLVSWKWMINKKDVTIVVAPEQGKDLDVNEVGRRIMKLAEKNSKAFQRANAKRAERLANLQANDTKIAELDRQLNTLTSNLNSAKAERDDARAKYEEAKKKHDDDAAQAAADAYDKLPKEIRDILFAGFTVDDPDKVNEFQLRNIPKLFEHFGHKVFRNNGLWVRNTVGETPRNPDGSEMNDEQFNDFVSQFEGCTFDVLKGKFFDKNGAEIDIAAKIKKVFSPVGKDFNTLMSELPSTMRMMLNRCVNEQGIVSGTKYKVNTFTFLMNMGVDHTETFKVNSVLYRPDGKKMTAKQKTDWVLRMQGLTVDLESKMFYDYKGNPISWQEIYGAVTGNYEMPEEETETETEEKEYDWKTAPLDTPEQIIEFADKVDSWAYYSDENSKGYRLSQALRKNWPTFSGTDDDGIPFTASCSPSGEWRLKGWKPDSDGVQWYLDEVIGAFEMAFKNGSLKKGAHTEMPKEAWELKPLNTIADIGKFIDEEYDWYSWDGPQGTKIREAMKSLGWTDFKGVNEAGIEFEHRLLPDGRYSYKSSGYDDKPNFPMAVSNLVQAYENGSLTKIGEPDKKPDESKIVNPDEWEVEMLRREEEAVAKENYREKTITSEDPQWDSDAKFCNSVINGDLASLGDIHDVMNKLADIGDRADASGKPDRIELIDKAFAVAEKAVISSAKQFLS